MMNAPTRNEAQRDDAGRIAVVGAGLTGLACAAELERSGRSTVVFDRGRRPGGRVATRRTTTTDGHPVVIDHGAPGAEVRDPAFRRLTDEWIEAGVATSITPRVGRLGADRLEILPEDPPVVVGLPDMNAIPTHLAGSLPVVGSTTVTGLERLHSGWRLETTRHGEGPKMSEPFDAVVLAIAPPQALRLLAGFESPILEPLERIPFSTIWIGMLLLEGHHLELPDRLHTPGDPVVEAVMINRTEDDRTTIAVHARTDWSAERYEEPRESMAIELRRAGLRVLAKALGREVRAHDWVQAHRWGMARATDQLEERVLVDRDNRIVACGDGLGGTDIESCSLGGIAAAREIVSWS
jgi:renalase